MVALKNIEIPIENRKVQPIQPKNNYITLKIEIYNKELILYP